MKASLVATWLDVIYRGNEGFALSHTMVKVIEKENYSVFTKDSLETKELVRQLQNEEYHKKELGGRDLRLISLVLTREDMSIEVLYARQ